LHTGSIPVVAFRNYGECMKWLPIGLRSWWRRVTTLEPIPDDQPSGHGLVPDHRPEPGQGPAEDAIRDLPPGAAGSGL
jgi:hypothetical protein